MAKSNWRKSVNLSIKDYLESLVEEVHQHRESYKKSKNPANAQIWCALANISKQIFDLNLKLKLLEKALKDNLDAKKTHIQPVPDKKERAELMKIASNPVAKKDKESKNP